MRDDWTPAPGPEYAGLGTDLEVRMPRDVRRRHRHPASQSAYAVLDAAESLRDKDPHCIIADTPSTICRHLGFGRAMISTVRGSMWIPRCLHVDGFDSTAHRLEQFIDDARFPLAIAPLETELVRKRMGAVVDKPAADKRTFKEIVDASGCAGYVAAPITLHGRTIGLLHADRPREHDGVTGEHLQRLELFSEFLSIAFEVAVLRSRTTVQVEQLGDIIEAIRQPTDEDVPGTAGQMNARALTANLSILSPREREILEYTATGATNAQIARSLALSEGTVKSHLRQISRKLNTTSRAAAVATFLRMSRTATSPAR